MATQSQLPSWEFSLYSNPEAAQGPINGHITLICINFQLSDSHRLRNLPYSVILTKHVYFRLVKLDGKGKSCCANEQNKKLHCSAPLKAPKNHRTMTKINRLHILCIEKLSWRFYQNRMKKGGAIVQRGCYQIDRRQTDIMITIPRGIKIIMSEN